ncbi:MAG: hypothetical protein GY830_00850 [Bacteroidetes bacterium]|nr:hypothetical protein [Bacteroidota bacterium]
MLTNTNYKNINEKDLKLFSQVGVAYLFFPENNNDIFRVRQKGQKFFEEPLSFKNEFRYNDNDMEGYMEYKERKILIENFIIKPKCSTNNSKYFGYIQENILNISKS